MTDPIKGSSRFPQPTEEKASFHQLIYSCSSNLVDNSEHLFNGDIPKQGIRIALREKILEGVLKRA